MGFVPSREEKGRLLKKYRSVPGRKIETSVVLADSKESTSFFPRPIRFNYRNRLHGVSKERNLFGGEDIITGGSQGLGLAMVEAIAACAANVTAISP
jgi:hypothetical protein